MAKSDCKASTEVAYKKALFRDLKEVTNHLSFYSVRMNGQRIETSDWAPGCTGRYGEDCAIGRMYADEYLEYLDSEDEVTDHEHLLGEIVEGMIEAAEQDKDREKGLRIGFFARISEEIIAWKRASQPERVNDHG